VLTIHCSLSQLLFCPFLFTLFPSLPPLPFHPYLSPHYLYLLHTHHPLTSLLYQLCTTEAPAIPDTIILHYNNRNTPPPHTMATKLRGPYASFPISPPLLTTPFNTIRAGKYHLDKES
jgi:hypothetical protein